MRAWRSSSPTTASRAGTRRLPGGAGLAGFVLGRALGHHAVGIDDEALGTEGALDHDLGAVLEGIGNDAAVGRLDQLPVVRDLEPVIERVRLAPDVRGMPMQLQALAVPLGRRRHHFVDVLVVLRILGEARVEHGAERQPEHDGRDRDLGSLGSAHGVWGGRWETHRPRADYDAGCTYFARCFATCAVGRPTTLG